MKEKENNTFLETKPHSSKATKISTTKLIFIVIAVSLVLFFGVRFFMQNNNPQYGDYNQHEDAYFTERGSIIKNLKQAQEDFNAKKYKEAILNFEIVLKEYDKPEIRFFYGISLLEENRFMDCETVFNKIKLGTSIYREKATWYLALSNLKQKKMDECKIYLKQIPADAEDYSQAQKLLKELD